MTVSELITKLQALHGDPDLRTVVVRMNLSRPYSDKPQMVGGNSIDDVRLSHDVVELTSHGYTAL